MKIFLVEDSRVVRERLRGMATCIPGIALAGETDNEEDAIREIIATLPDVVILDLYLADGSGLGVLRRIRLQPFAIKMIVLTNHSNPCYRDTCVNLGADYFLDKTHEISQLESLLNQLVRH